VCSTRAKWTVCGRDLKESFMQSSNARELLLTNES